MSQEYEERGTIFIQSCKRLSLSFDICLGFNLQITLGVQTFASRNFREVEKSRNLRHKLSRIRRKKIFREHKLSRIVGKNANYQTKFDLKVTEYPLNALKTVVFRLK